MLGKWKKTLEKGAYICAIFMDFSKSFGLLNHNLFIAKLGACGLDTKALYYVKSYLDNRKQRVRSLLTNIFMNDLFPFVSSSKLSNTLMITLYILLVITLRS